MLDAVGSERAAVLGRHRRRAHRDPLRRHLPGPRQGARALRCLRSTDTAPVRTTRSDSRPEDVDAHIAYTEPRWGSGVGLRLYCPSAGDDPVAREQLGRFQRASASPGAAAEYLRTVAQIDVRRALPMVDAPTLVLHASRDRVIPIELARYVAERIPDATLAEVDSADHLIWFSDAVDAVADQIQDFLIGAVPNREIRRVLATVVFIVGLRPRPRITRGRGRLRGDARTVIGTVPRPHRPTRRWRHPGHVRRTGPSHPVRVRARGAPLALGALGSCGCAQRRMRRHQHGHKRRCGRHRPRRR